MENIPQELKQRKQWIPAIGKKTYTRQWNRPESQRGFQESLEKSRPYPGFVLRDGVFCLDFDKVLSTDEKTLSEGARTILKAIREKAGTTYTEKSQSGRGYHAFYYGTIPPDFPDTLKIVLGPVMEPVDINSNGKPDGNRLEVYTGTGKGRYIAITGDIVNPTKSLANGTLLLSYLLELAKKKPTSQKEPATACNNAEPVLSVDEIPAKIRQSKQGKLFKALFDKGDTSRYAGDDSAADLALMNILPFWCNGDADIMEKVFSLSALAQRPKWQDREDYRKRTIERALKDWNGKTYHPERYTQNTADHDFENLDASPDIVPALVWPVVDATAKGQPPIKQAWENTDYLLGRLSIQCRYNMLTKEIDFSGHGLDKLKFDASATIIRSLMYRNGLKISRADLIDNIGAIAEKNRYSPVREYLKACQTIWDGQNHIKELFGRLELNPDMQQDKDFCEMLFRRWLIGATRIAFNEGNDSMQGVLVLQGPQGIGKTRFLYALLPEPAWGADGISLDPSIKDDVLKVLRLWLVELGELGETLRKEKLDRLKQFFTQRADDLRRPYGHTTEKIPRTTAFIGTVNGTGFLKDSTGDRRYWVIAVTAIHDLEQVDITQVWGQAMNLAFVQQEHHWLDTAEIEQLNNANEPYKKVTDEEQAILDRLDWGASSDKWTARTASEISREIGLHGGRLVLIGKAVNNIARRDSRVRIPTNRRDGRKYLLPPAADEDKFLPL